MKRNFTWAFGLFVLFTLALIGVRSSVASPPVPADSKNLAQLKLIAGYLAPTTPYVSISGANTGVSVVAGAKTLRFFSFSNSDSAGVWVKLYDKATAATSSDTPKMIVWVPTLGTVVNTSRATFALGISFRVVTEATDAGTTSPTANKVQVNLEYN